MKQSSIFVGDPQSTCCVLDDRTDKSARHMSDRHDAVIRQVSEPGDGRDPDLPLAVLKYGKWTLPVSFSPCFNATHTPLAKNHNLTVVRSAQIAVSNKPNASILGCQNGHNSVTRQALLGRKRRDRKFAKAVETVDGQNPNVALAIFEERSSPIG